MSNSSDIQLYLSQKLSEIDLAKELHKVTNRKAESLDYPDEEAQLYFYTMDYTNAGHKLSFPFSINVGWKPKANIILDAVHIAQKIALDFNIYVATDLPSTDQEYANPYLWCVAEPNGTLVKMAECTLADDEEIDGLVLDVTTRTIVHKT